MSNISNKQKFIEAFHKAVDQASFVLKENPELTFPQLYNRLQWQTKEKVFLKRKLEFERKRFKKPWFPLLTRPAQSSALIRTLTGHTGGVSACAFSPDGSRIVLGDERGQVIIVSIENIEIFPAIVTPFIQSGELFFQCQYCQEINQIDESSLGQEVYCSSCRKTVKLNPFTIQLD